MAKKTARSTAGRTSDGRPPGRQLARLVKLTQAFEGGAEKRALVEALAEARLGSAEQVVAFHDALLVLRARPDDRPLLAAVERALEGFGAREDVARFAERLADSGLAGTPLHFPWHYRTASWLAARWGTALRIDWSRSEPPEDLGQLLAPLFPYAEIPDLEALGLTPAELLARAAGPGETDATFLLGRLARLEAPPLLVETLHDRLGLCYRLEPTSGSPSFTQAALGASRVMPKRQVVWQRHAPRRGRPDLAAALKEPPVSVEAARGRLAELHIDRAREAMATRARELDGILYASPEDVRVIDAGDGLWLSCIGLLPAYRALVETIYVFVLFHNGVPIGYFQAALLFDSAEVNFNVFPPHRGTEAAFLYARSLAVVHHLFGVDSFAVEPYQLGEGNDEALESGAYWFYAKLGFQPKAARGKRLRSAEERRLAADPKHRSSRAVLEALARDPLFFHLGRARDDVAGLVPLSRFSLVVTEELREAGVDREGGLRQAVVEARRRLGSRRALDEDEARALERWSPLLAALPGLERWPAADRRAVLDVVAAKGGRREEVFAAGLRDHRRLRRAVLGLVT
ncbi:MAG: hypothetical protein R3B72_07915 [Polyangiaceae bacterium]